MSFISAPAVNPGSQLYLIGTTSRTLTPADDGKTFKFSGALGTFDVALDSAALTNMINTGKGFYCRFCFEGTTAIRTTVPAGWSYQAGATSGAGPASPVLQPASSGATWGVCVQRSGANMAVNIISDVVGALSSSTNLMMTSNNRLSISPFSVATANAGGGAAVPATVSGFIFASIDGVIAKIPYFAN